MVPFVLGCTLTCVNREFPIWISNWCIERFSRSRHKESITRAGPSEAGWFRPSPGVARRDGDEDDRS